MRYEEKLLPYDVMIEILSWLPPETLLKFRSICKSWFSTINDAKFISKHQSHFGNSLRNNNTNGRIIVLTEKDANPDTALKLRILPDNNPEIINDEDMEDTSFCDGSYSRVMGSCHGLFCYASVKLDYMEIQLCNPCVRRAIVLPSYRLTDEYCPIDFYYGVGFDQFANDYKVIKFKRRVMMFRRPVDYVPAVNHGPGEAAIYSVKHKSWRRLNVPVPPNVAKGRSVFLQGNIHWLAYSESPNSEIDKIMLFDVCNEVFGEMQLPVTDRNNVTSISVVKGSLCLLVTDNWVDFDKNKICDVWVMKEYGFVESWTKQFRVVLKKEIVICIEVTHGGKILCSSERGGYREVYRNGVKFQEPLPSPLILYDPETDEYKSLGKAPSPYHVFSMVASLELLEGPI